MPTPSKLPQAKQVPLVSPIGGIVRTNAREQQRVEASPDGKPPTCWNALNVLPFDSYGRARVAQRFGITKKFLPQLGNGTEQIQGMISVNELSYSNNSSGGTSGNTTNLIPGPNTIPTNTTGTLGAGSGGNTGTAYNIPTGTVTGPGGTGGSGTTLTTLVMQTFSVTYTVPAAALISGSILVLGPTFDLNIWNTYNNVAGSGAYTSELQLAASLAGTLQNSFTVSNQGTGYSGGTTLIISAPQIAGGVQATGTVSVSGGHIQSITISNGGSGYTSATLSLGSTGGGTGFAYAGGNIIDAVIETIPGKLTGTANPSGTSILNLAVAAEPATVYYAFVFQPQSANTGKWGFYANTTAATLIATLQTLAAAASPSLPYTYDVQTGGYIGPETVPPAIPFTMYSGQTGTTQMYAVMNDWTP